MFIEQQLTQNTTNGVSGPVSDHVEESKSIKNYLLSDNFEETEIDDERKMKIQALETFITSRKTLMEGAQSNFRNIYMEGCRVWDTPSYIYKDGQPLFNTPIEKSLVLTAEAEIGEKDILYDIRPVGSDSDVDKLEPNRVVMEHFYFKDKTSKKSVDFRDKYFKFGFSVIFEGVTAKSKKIRGEDSKYKEFSSILEGSDEIVKVITESHIGSRVLNPKNFLIDDGVLDFDEAIDCIELEYLSEREVLRRFNGKAFFNLSTAFETLKPTNNEITHYWNQAEDIYGILVNSKLIYEGKNPYAHKLLPYTVAVMKPSLYSPYGEGGFIRLAQFATNFISSLLNITIRQSQAASMPPLLMGSNVDFDSNEAIIDVGAIWRINGPLAEIREMRISSPDSSIFEVIKKIIDMLAEETGLDIRQLYTSGDATKYQTAISEQAKNKKLTTYIKTLNYAYESFLTQRIDNIHQYISASTVTPLIDPGVSEIVYKKILLEDTKVQKTDTGYIFTNVPGAYSEFELKPSEIRGDFRVTIQTESTKRIFPELRKKEAIEVISGLERIRNMYPNADMEQIVPMKNISDYLFNIFEVEMDKLTPITKKKILEVKSAKINDQLEELKRLTSSLPQVLQNQTPEATEATPVNTNMGVVASTPSPGRSTLQYIGKKEPGEL